MPRIFSPAEGHTMDWGAIDFINGASSVAVGSDTAFFTAEGYTIDANKHALTVFDKMTRADICAVCDYLAVAYLAADTKAQIIRKLETGISALKLGALTVTSVAGTDQGDTNITVTEALTGTLKYKVAATALSPLYRDIPDSTWKAFASADDLTAATGQEITVVEINASGEIIRLGHDTVAAKA